MLEWGSFSSVLDGPLQESVEPKGLVATAKGISKCGWAILASGHGYAARLGFRIKGEGFRHCSTRVEPRFEQLGSGKRKGKKNSRNRVSGEVGCCCVCFVFSCFIIVFYLFSSLVVSSCLF